MNKSNLFKDYEAKRISEYKENSRKLLEARKKPQELKKVLKISEISLREPKFDYCRCGCREEFNKTITEKRIVKCMFYRNKCSNKKCYYYDLGWNLTNAKLLDYEVPVNDCKCSIGEIDAIIDYKGTIYATEVKPEKSNETILRMISEILTYDCFNKNRKFLTGKYEKLAIAFFENSKQYEEYKGNRKGKTKEGYENIKEIIKTHDINVFLIKGDRLNRKLELLEKH